MKKFEFITASRAEGLAQKSLLDLSEIEVKNAETINRMIIDAAEKCEPFIDVEKKLITPKLIALLCEGGFDVTKMEISQEDIGGFLIPTYGYRIFWMHTYKSR